MVFVIPGAQDPLVRDVIAIAFVTCNEAVVLANVGRAVDEILERFGRKN